MNKHKQSPSHKALHLSTGELVRKALTLQDLKLTEAEAAEWNKAVNQSIQCLVRKP